MLVRDLRHALRIHRRRPLTTAAVVVTALTTKLPFAGPGLVGGYRLPGVDEGQGGD